MIEKLQVTPQLIKFFDGNDLSHNIAGYLTNYPELCTLYGDGTSYALAVDYGDSTDCCLLTSDMSFVDGITNILHGDVSFCGVTENVKEHLLSRFTPTYVNACHLYVWDGTTPPHVCTGDLRKIDSAIAQKISDGTFYHASPESIVEAVENRPSSSLYVDGKPVCWCLLHEDNSLGMLYTLPQHRHKGYALEVMTHLVNQVIADGKTPFCYIVEGNVASENLALKYSLKKVCPSIYLGFMLD